MKKRGKRLRSALRLSSPLGYQRVSQPSTAHTCIGLTSFCITGSVNLFERHPEFRLGINLSPVDLHDAPTVELLTMLTAGIKARAGNVMIEVTERGFTDPKIAG